MSSTYWSWPSPTCWRIARKNPAFAGSARISAIRSSRSGIDVDPRQPLEGARVDDVGGAVPVVADEHHLVRVRALRRTSGPAASAAGAQARAAVPSAPARKVLMPHRIVVGRRRPGRSRPMTRCSRPCSRRPRDR